MQFFETQAYGVNKKKLCKIFKATKTGVELWDVQNDQYQMFLCAAEPNCVFLRVPSVPHSTVATNDLYVKYQADMQHTDSLIIPNEQATRTAIVGTEARRFKWLKFQFKDDNLRLTLEGLVDFGDNTVEMYAAPMKQKPIELAEEIYIDKDTGEEVTKNTTTYQTTAVKLTWHIGISDKAVDLMNEKKVPTNRGKRAFGRRASVDGLGDGMQS